MPSWQSLTMLMSQKPNSLLLSRQLHAFQKQSFWMSLAQALQLSALRNTVLMLEDGTSVKPALMSIAESNLGLS